MIDQGVFFSNFTDLSNNVQSVQIQRGVGTSANGTASFAGSVGFESISIQQEQPSAEVELVGGSFNTYRGSASVSSGILDNKWAFSSRFTTFASDGYRNNTDTKSRSFYGSAGYFGEKDMVKVTGFIGRSQNGLGYLPVAISDINTDPKTNYLNENDRDDFSQWFIQALHTHAFSDQLSLASNLYYGGAGGDYFFTYDNGAGGLDQINYPLRNDHLGIMSNVNYQNADGRLNLYGGIHAYTFRRTNWEEFMPDKANPYYTEKSRKDEFSMFAKADYSLGKLKLYGDIQLRTLGLDIDPDEALLPGQGTITKNWTFLNPKIGLSYKVNRYNSLYISYGRNGREQKKIDLFGGFQLNPSNLSQVLADSVRPEYVNDIEAGLNFSYPWLTGQLNVFYMKFRDEIAPIGEYVPEGFLQLRKNMPGSFRTGIEIAARIRIVDELHFDFNTTYMQARIDEYAPEGDQVYENVTPALTPEWTGSGTLNYAFAKRFTISLTGRYNSESYLEPTNNEAFVMPSFFVADAGLSVSFWKASHFDIFLNNIFDTQYFTYGAPVDLDFDGAFDEPGYFVQPPRNFYAKLVIGF
jgi:iron complex outermembrane receptor protein